jgi:hypothetical protein
MAASHTRRSKVPSRYLSCHCVYWALASEWEMFEPGVVVRSNGLCLESIAKGAPGFRNNEGHDG